MFYDLTPLSLTTRSGYDQGNYITKITSKISFCSMFNIFSKVIRVYHIYGFWKKLTIKCIRIYEFYRGLSNKHLCVLDLFFKLYLKYIYRFRFSFVILKLVRKSTLFVNVTITAIYLESYNYYLLRSVKPFYSADFLIFFK